jgi:tight adherence protein C
MNTEAILVGVLLGTGLSFVVAWWRSRRLTLARRIAPYLREAQVATWDLPDAPSTPFGALEKLLAPVLRDGMSVFERWGSPRTELAGRLRRAGSPLTVDAYRAEQLLWGLGGLAAGLALAGLLVTTRDSSWLPLVAVVVAAALGGSAARDLLLSRAIVKRERRVVAELPTISELLALSVGAGEGVLGALERVSRTASGVVAQLLGEVLASARAGTSLPEALRVLGRETSVPALGRFTDSVATAIERGTPLADVLRAQAQDVRGQARDALVEEGGRREIAMMVPVVFLILPITVIFAVFPGAIALRFGA